MTPRSKANGQGRPAENASGAAREDRLKAALKANLARRKAQARQRAASDQNDTGPSEAENEES